jgi:hypothetical protein
VPPIFKRPSALLLGAAAVAVLFIMPAGLRADEKDAPTLSDSVGDGLAKLEPLLTAKDWNGAMVLVEGLLQTAAPDSYDAAILNRTEAQILTQKGDYTGVVAPLERALEISDRHHFFTGKEQSDILYFLSQLYYQLADQQKGDRASEVADLAKAIGYIERWFTVAPKPTEDNSLYYAQLLYADAVAKDPAHPDAELIKRSREQVEKTLLMSVHPKDGLYIFLRRRSSRSRTTPGRPRSSSCCSPTTRTAGATGWTWTCSTWPSRRTRRTRTTGRSACTTSGPSTRSSEPRRWAS